MILCGLNWGNNVQNMSTIPFNAFYFLDNRYRQCQCVYSTHTISKLTLRQPSKLTFDREMSEYDPYLAISLFGHFFPGIAKNAFPELIIYPKFLGHCFQGFAPYRCEHALRQIYTGAKVPDSGAKNRGSWSMLTRKIKKFEFLKWRLRRFQRQIIATVDKPCTAFMSFIDVEKIVNFPG